jgi:hypothetical protein
LCCMCFDPNLSSKFFFVGESPVPELMEKFMIGLTY